MSTFSEYEDLHMMQSPKNENIKICSSAHGGTQIPEGWLYSCGFPGLARHSQEYRLHVHRDGVTKRKQMSRSYRSVQLPGSLVQA